MAIEQITTHVTDAKDRLGWFFSDKANVLALVEVGAERFQQLENLWFAALERGTLEGADGAWLDDIGEIVGQPRLGGAYPLGEADAVYYRKIMARIVVNQSGGTFDDLAAVCEAWLGAKYVKAFCSEIFPSGLSIAVQCSAALTTDEAATLLQFLLATKGAGVRLVNAGWFVGPTFGWSPGSTDPPIQGWGGATPGVGGGWAVYFYP